MFTLEVEYLTGTVVATDRQRRSKVEWPPHPQRLFSALVAAWGECDLGDEVRAALSWLQTLPPPELSYSQHSVRKVRPVFVPVNDSGVPARVPASGFSDRQLATGREVLPEFRGRQERYFPAVIPADPLVRFIWREAAEFESHREALERVAAEVGYLGHSSSLVRVAVVDGAFSATLRPAKEGETVATTLRVASAGRLETLCHRYELSREVGRRIEPPEGRFQGYTMCSRTDVEKTQLAFGESRDWFVFRQSAGRKLGLAKTLALTQTVRRALLKHADQAGVLPNELLSGHREDGSASVRTHVAIVPLAFTGHRFADGEIKGFAIVLPREHSQAERRGVLAALHGLKRLYGNGLDWEVERQSSAGAMRALVPERWQCASRFWATITPLVFGHHPGRRFDSPKTVRVIAESCRQVGLPEPKAVLVSMVSKHQGVPHAREFGTLTAGGKPASQDARQRKRLRAHVALEFDGPVAGPVILGSGRYYGMGFCAPWWPTKKKEGN